MKTKSFTLIGISAIILAVISLVSALTLTVSNPEVLSGSSNSSSFTITSNESSNFVNSFPIIATIKDSKNKEVIVSITNTSKLTAVNSATFEVKATSIAKDFSLGTYQTNVTLNAISLLSSSTSSISVPIQFKGSYCELGEKGSNIRINTLKDERLDNSDSWKWRPMDNIEITVEIENRGNEDIDDGIIEYGLFDKKTNEFIFEDEINFDLNEDDEEKFTIKSNIDPTDLNDNTGDSDYLFIVKAYDDDIGQDEQCKQISQEVTIKRNKDEVTFKPEEVKTNPSTITCGSKVDLIAKLYNIGKNDQDDVSAVLVNTELGLNQRFDVGSIDFGDTEDAIFSFDIPQDAKDKTYNLKLSVLDEDEDVYEIKNFKGDKHSVEYTVPLTVSGCTPISTTPEISITAKLESGGKAGQDLVIKSTIINTGSKSESLVIKANDYEEWATLSSIEPGLVIVSAGQSKEVLITLNVNKGISGEQSFILEAQSGNNQKITQPVSVTIEKTSSGNFISGDNWYLWAIGAFNIILVIIIIFVAIRVSKK